MHLSTSKSGFTYAELLEEDFPEGALELLSVGVDFFAAVGPRLEIVLLRLTGWTGLALILIALALFYCSSTSCSSSSLCSHPVSPLYFSLGQGNFKLAADGI